MSIAERKQIQISSARGIPRKQDRMFHIELGQNDGPFKNTFDANELNDLFRTAEKPRDGLSLKEELNREQPENFDTVHNIMERISNYSKKAIRDLAECKETEVNLREEVIKDIHDMVEKNNSETLEKLQPLIQRNYKELKQSLKTEKEENEQLMKQLLKIRKDFSSMSLQITSCDNKSNQLHNGILGELERAEQDPDLDI